MALSGRSRRKKGHDFERKVANILRETFPEFAGDIRRTLQSRAGFEGSDVHGLPLHWIECKTGKATIQSALKQAIRDSKGNGIPVAINQYHHFRYPIVSLRLDDYLGVLRRAFGFEVPYVGKNQSISGEARSGRGRPLVFRNANGKWRIRLYSNKRHQ